MSESDAGKGDNNRSDSKAYRDNFDRIFNKPDKPKQEKPDDEPLIIPNHGQYYGASNQNNKSDIK